MNNLLTYKKLVQIFLYTIPGIFTYHALMAIFADITLPIPAWLVALAFAIYVSATVYKEFNKVPKKAVARRAKKPKQVSVSLTPAVAKKLKKLGLV